MGFSPWEGALDYSIEYVKTLLQGIDEASADERIDLRRAWHILNEEDRQFLSHVYHGHSVRAAGRLIGRPRNANKRFNRICTGISMFLEGGD